MTKKHLKIIVFIFLQFTVLKSYSQYTLNRKDSTNLTLDSLLIEIKNADIVLFGELHDDTLCHKIQLEIVEELYEIKKQNLIIGAEMFETDNQLVIDEYFSDLINQKSFENECKLWKNYQTDYKPILEFSKRNHLRLIATNTPRRYASSVYNYGFEVLNSLTKTAKKYISPLPILYDSTLDCYKNINSISKYTGVNLAKSQALKDATMAYFIYKNWKKKKLFFHINGAYHSESYQGIYWYLKKYKSKLNIVTVSFQKRDKIDYSKSDYIFQVKKSQ